MTQEKSKTGQTGEQVAANYLCSKGFSILAMNYCNASGRRVGEIDIVAKENGEIVFVEVKTREYTCYGKTLPEENITYQKLRKLAKTADLYLRANRIADHPYRFDAISVWLDYQTRMAKIKHIPNIYL